MINKLANAVLDGVVENLPTALVMAGLAAVTAFVGRRRTRKRTSDNDNIDGQP